MDSTTDSLAEMLITVTGEDERDESPMASVKCIEKSEEKGLLHRYGRIYNPITQRPSDCGDISRITDRLFLGQYKKGAGVKSLLTTLGITHILSVGNGLPPLFPDDFTYKIIFIDDSKSEDLGKYFGECIKFIQDAFDTAPTHRVLIHCWAGVSRSASVVVAYLIYTFGYDYAEAQEHVRRARWWHDGNPGFRKQLKDFTVSLTGLKTGDPRLTALQKKWTAYEELGPTLRKMHAKRHIQPELASTVQQKFDVIFGPAHPFSLQIREELDFFSNSPAM